MAAAVVVVAHFPGECRDVRYSAERRRGLADGADKDRKIGSVFLHGGSQKRGCTGGRDEARGGRPREREGGSLTVKLKKLPRPWNTESVGVGRRRPSSSVICVHKIPRRVRPKACRREYY